ncbi:MAG: GGDEF domain-containing protein [Gammaproteobacteria bacterium]|nr:GGDEF domain-containing protein [Gammaproteobacteria bacterium]
MSRLELRSSEVAAINVGVNSIETIVQSIIIDLAYLATEDGLLNLINRENHELYTLPPADWPAFSQIKGIYDQIRWLDTNGQERARVDFNNGKPLGVPEHGLQGKGNRYYFTDTIKLSRGEFYLSPLDLNIEHGEIEQPVKPMLRIGTPVFDSKNNKQGIVLLNYLGGRMLQYFDQMMAGTHSQVWIINRDGYWLRGPSDDLEWGFMYQKPEASMGYHYPAAWDTISGTQKGQFEDAQGLWTFNTIYPLKNKLNPGRDSIIQPHLDAREYFWKVVLMLPDNEFQSLSSKAAINISVATTIILGVMFFVSWKLAHTWVRLKGANEEIHQINLRLEHTVLERTLELEEAKKKAEKSARTDELTGLNNLRSFDYFGNAIIEQSRRNEKTFTFIMLDIDFFKKINDTYGHHAGDLTLKAVSNCIIEGIRASDICARIGGEEFGILLPETTARFALIQAERLRQSFSDIVVPYDKSKITLTVSFGIAESCDDDTSIENVRMRADKALYLAKKQGRNRVVLLKS